jgi:hypothetical protein
MKKINLYLMMIALMPVLSSCDLIGGIFKAGMVWGIFLVVAIVAAIIWLITRGRGKNP